MEHTKIEWTDHTFNPFIGCTKVSPGCDHCYAEHLMDKRMHRVVWGPHGKRVRTSASTWQQPIRWNARHDAFVAAHGRRQRVFCASLADVFDNAVDPQWRADLFDLVERTPNLDWLLLTKRIGNVPAMVRDAGSTELPGNVWLGATIVNQAEADRDIPKLLATRARVKFLSIEPLLGPVDISAFLQPSYPHCKTGFVQGGRCERDYCGICGGHANDPIHNPAMHDMVDWVIVGGESGPGARPMHPDWASSLRDQCAAAGVPFLFKQWGEWLPAETDGESYAVADDGSDRKIGGPLRVTRIGVQPMLRVGKGAAGRLLDGRTHDEFPEVA